MTGEIRGESGTSTQSRGRATAITTIIRLLREFIEMCDLAYFASENRRLMLVPWRKLCGLERERKKIIHQSDLFP